MPVALVRLGTHGPNSSRGHMGARLGARITLGWQCQLRVLISSPPQVIVVLGNPVVLANFASNSSISFFHLHSESSISQPLSSNTLFYRTKYSLFMLLLTLVVLRSKILSKTRFGQSTIKASPLSGAALSGSSTSNFPFFNWLTWNIGCLECIWFSSSSS